jgi:SAM-dependent methyltransferase
MNANTLWQVNSEDYRGLPVRCAPGVHAACSALLRSHVPAGARILDLASGSGAFLARLEDEGYRNLLAVERDTGNYRLEQVPCLSVDLDRPFAQHIGTDFDAVSAIEIIEHLSNPIAFLQEVRKLLAPRGVVLLSTPNVADWQSRLKFLLTGRLRYFDEAQYRYQRHISPILPDLVPAMLEEAGLSLISMRAVGSFAGPLKRLTVGTASAAWATLTGSARANGECLLILARAAPAGPPPAA